MITKTKETTPKNMAGVKTTSAIFLFLLFSFFNKPFGYAQNLQENSEPFEFNYDITYDIDETGLTYVTQNIGIVNKQKDVVATKYALTVKKTGIFDVTAASETTNIQATTIEESDDITKIEIQFEDVTIGLDRQTNFSITYKTYDMAFKTGEIWSLNIPRVSLLTSTKNYTATVKVPVSFGDEIFVSPSTYKQQIEKDGKVLDKTQSLATRTKRTYVFDKQELEANGITGSFGTYQPYKFTVEYTLTNNSYFDTVKTITLPPDVENRQQVRYKLLHPEPKQMFQDQDGNYIAEYKVKPNSTLSIRAIGTVRILSAPIDTTNTNSNLIGDIPQELIDKYTKATKYWNADDERIKAIASSLKDPNVTVLENSKRAYDFVLNRLEYDFDILTQTQTYVVRKGGLNALDNNKGTGCMEFTDLFISLVRAMGIPAREINGYSLVDENKNFPLSINLDQGDILHAWPEFYAPSHGWIQVDPTWESTSGLDYFTKLDTNHIVFIKKGINPELPLPPGAYKTDGDAKQITVELDTEYNEGAYLPKLELYNTLSLNPLNFIQKNSSYFVKNSGDTSLTIKNQQHEIALLPKQHKKMNIENVTKDIVVFDTFGNSHPVTPIVTNITKYDTKTIYFGAVVLVLGLCVIFYLLVDPSQFPKRLFRRLFHRLRGQDQ